MAHRTLTICILTELYGLTAAGMAGRMQVQVISASDTTKLKNWNDFHDLEGLRHGEPVLLKGAAAWLADQWSVDSITSLNGDDLVEVEYTQGSDFKSYANVRQNSMTLKWKTAKKVLLGEHLASSEYSFYLHQQALMSPKDPFLSKLASSLPHSLRYMSPMGVLFWLSGSQNHTSSLHFDAEDNAFLLLHGQKHVLLHAPWDGVNLACGRRLFENGFKFEEVDGLHPEVGITNFPSQPKWMTSCQAYQEHAVQWSAVLQRGDILWIPAGWFHTVLSSPGSAAFSIFNSKMMPVPGLVVSLLRSSHVSDSHDELDEGEGMEDAHQRLTDQVQTEFPDLQDLSGSVDNDKNNLAVVLAFRKMLQQSRQVRFRGREECSIWTRLTQAIHEMKHLPGLAHLSGVLEDSLNRLSTGKVRPSVSDIIDGAMASLRANSTAVDLLEWWQEVFPGCQSGGGSGSCKQIMQGAALVCAQPCQKKVATKAKLDL